MDAVDRILAQWRDARPDLNVDAMGPVGRFSRVAMWLTRGMGETFAKHGLNAAGFDLLATLRRAPPPHALSAGDLMASMMITSGSVTNRIDQLVKADLVDRKADLEDGRRAVISLTEKGFEIIDRAVAEHVETQRQLLGALSEEEITQLDGLLQKMMVGFEGVVDEG